MPPLIAASLEELIANHSLLVVGAEYCLETGKVDFFDGVPGERELRVFLGVSGNNAEFAEAQRRGGNNL